MIGVERENVVRMMAELKQIVDMERVLQYIMEHLDEDLTISQVADYFQYNEAYFAKKFEF